MLATVRYESGPGAADLGFCPGPQGSGNQFTGIRIGRNRTMDVRASYPFSPDGINSCAGPVDVGNGIYTRRDCSGSSSAGVGDHACTTESGDDWIGHVFDPVYYDAGMGADSG